MTTNAEASAPGPMVVGIGASAGSLAALRELFAHVPKDSGLAYVVVIHLSPDTESQLAEVLQPDVPIPVRQVAATTKLEPDHVYVIPPGHNLSAIDSHLRLTGIEDEIRERSPINHFFRTLAASHDGRSIGVILTGTGSDGTLGIRDIHEQGGLVIVQDPAEAEYDGMPQSAVASGIVDLVLPLADIADAIIRFASTEPEVPLEIPETDSEAEQRRLVRKIFAHLHSRTGRDFSRYKESTILRRIRRRMQLLQVVALEDYVQLLRDDPDEVDALADDLLITVTHFFRDPDVFEDLADQVIPALFRKDDDNDSIRVWSVGCATGEEAYSLAILLLEEAGRRDLSDESLQVFATDLHDRSLERAREGIYSSDIETDVGAGRLRRFFRREGDAYRVRREVRERVVFAAHNLLRDPPFSRVDLIACRNLLIYLRRDTQRDVLELFHHSLNQGGFLVLGSSETLEIPDLFEVVDKRHSLFRKRDVPKRELKLPVFPISISKPRPNRARERPADTDAYEKLHQKLLESYAPPSLLVSPEGRVVHLSPGAGRYLEHPGGRPTAKILDLVRRELRIELRSLLHIASRRSEAHRSLPIPVSFDGESRMVILHVQPDTEAEPPGYALIVFEELVASGGDQEAADQPQEGDDLLATVEAELGQTRERLEGMLEEYESSQEEMQASNEELQSMNEELRSTLEELETNKEELQSMNEELQTVNQENRHKVEELAQLSSDLQNLLTSTDIATLFLDREFRILRFTPKVSELFSMRETDRGRPLSDLSHRLGVGDNGITEDARKVLETLVPIERELSDDGNCWYLMRLLPYRTEDDRIEGVVVTFIEITRRKHTEGRLRQSERKYRKLAKDYEDERWRLRATLDSMPVAIWLSDSSGGIILTNALARSLRTTEETGADLHATWQAITGVRENRADGCVSLALCGESVANITAEYERPDGGTGARLCSVTPVRTTGDSIIGVVMAVQDISELRMTEQALRRSERSLQRLAESLEHRVEERTSQVNALARQLTVAEQEERRRVSMVLHDDLQQLLHAVAMKLQIIREETGRVAKRELQQMLDEAAERIKAAITTSRNLTLDLTPPILRSEGLPEALQWLAHQMGELHDLDVSIEAASDFSVDDYAIRALAFQTVREILFNVKKHAGTNRADVVLEQNGGPSITISDEGRGFDTSFLDSDELPAAGFGLVTLRERLRLIGGSLKAVSQRGDGTLVIIRLPEAEAPGQ